jgi:hypothetical protein
VRKAAVVSAILAAGLVAAAVWVVARQDHPRPTLTTGDSSTSDGSTTAGGADDHGPTTGGPSAANGPRLWVSSLELSPGASLTVRGAGCPTDGLVTPAGPTVGDWSVHVWLSPAAGTVPWDPRFAEPVALVPPAADGSWSATVTVPAWHTEYRLEAACFDEASPPHGFLYRHERVVVS